MRKYFCDVCGRELLAHEHRRIHRALGKVRAEVIVTFNGVANEGEICHACIMEVLRKGEDANRP